MNETPTESITVQYKVSDFHALINYVNGSARYEFVSRDDYRHIICRDCSTRATVVAVPSDEAYRHDEWHREDEGQ